MTPLPKPTASPMPDLEAAAAAAGLLDIAYATLDSPAGRLLLAATPRGLVRLAYLDGGEQEDAVLEQLAHRISPRILDAPRRLDEPRRELEQYFESARNRFEIPIDWQLTRGFGRRVLEATARIPFGSASTYKQVATEAGSPGGHGRRATRSAPTRCRSSSPATASCTRHGGLGGYTGGLDRKRLLLAIESGQAQLT